MIWPPPHRSTAIVRLEPLGREHREGLREAADDPEIWTWMDRRIPAEAGAFDRWFDTRSSRSPSHGDEWCVRDHLGRRPASRSGAPPT